MKMTQKDLETLAYIRAAVRDTGRFPTLRDAMDALGLLSTSTMAYRFARLARAGEIQRFDTGPTKGFYALATKPGCCAGCGQSIPAQDVRTA